MKFNFTSQYACVFWEHMNPRVRATVPRWPWVVLHDSDVSSNNASKEEFVHTRAAVPDENDVANLGVGPHNRFADTQGC